MRLEILKGTAVFAALLAACSSFTGDVPTAPDGGPAADAGNNVVDAAVTTDSGATPVPDAAESTSPYAESVLSDHPLAYFRLSELEGPGVNLGSAPGLELTYGAGVRRQATGLIAGDGDLAVHIDGVDAVGKYLTALANRDIQPTAAITLECWFRRDGDSSDQFSYLISYDLRDQMPFQSYVLQLNGSMPSLHLINVGDENLTNGLTNNAIHHFVATYDGNNTLIYVDNSLLSTAQHSGALDYDGKRGLDIGGNSTKNQNAFNGTIDEVAIYGTALSPERMTAHYNIGAGH